MRAVTMRIAFCVVFTILTAGAASDGRIDLAEFGRVVQYTGDSPETLQVKSLDRGVDGWEAWKGPDGQYMIGLEFDEPRDLKEVGIEFRHAIADRHLVQVQYFKQHWPNQKRGGWAPVDDPFHGQWVTAKAEWWTGDRDVNFGFVPYNQEQPHPNAPDVTYRRTYRIRFLLGTRELPPVRYIHAYGPQAAADGQFDLRFERGSAVRLPLDVSVVNGFVLEGKDRVPAMETALDNEPASLVIRYARGDLETPTRTIVTLRNAADPQRGVSFVPAEAAKFGSIRVPSLGVTISHRGGAESQPAESRPVQTRASQDPPLSPPLARGGKAGETPAPREKTPGGSEEGASVYDRVAAEPQQTFARARREIPELDARQHGRYVPLGPPESRQEIGVVYDGSILLDGSSLKVPAADGTPSENKIVIRLRTGDPPTDQVAWGVVKQQRLEGYLPILVSRWEKAGVAYEQTCVATYLDGEPEKPRGDETVVLLVRLKASNPGSEARPAGARLTREFDNKSDRANLRESLLLQDSVVLVTGASKDGVAESWLFVRGDGWSISPAEKGPEDSVAWSAQLAAGQSRTVEWFVPFRHDVSKNSLGSLDFDRALGFEAGRWRKLVERAASFELPDPLLNGFNKASLVNLFITADLDPFKPMPVLPAGTFGYNVCLNESCHQVYSLEVRGLHADAQRYLDAMVLGQSSRGLHGRFTDSKGVFHGMPTKTGDYQTFNYNLDHGFVLWMLNEHYRFTRDREWLTRVVPAMIEGCDFVTRQCKVPPESNTLAREDQNWGAGLLPPGHLEDPPEWLWWFSVNAYMWRGMQATAESLKEINHPEAGRIGHDAAAFGDVLRRSCKEAMLRAPVVRLRDGTYVPFQPTRSRLRGRDVGWIRDALYGPIHLIDCGVYPAGSQEAEWILRDAEDNVFVGIERGYAMPDFERQWFSWGGMTLQPNLLPVPLVYLARGMPKHALRGFYNALCASVYADAGCFAEWVPRPGMGGGPFLKSPDESMFIVWLRHLLIAERGDDLELLAGLPAEWAGEGKTLAVRSAATWFGPMDLRVGLKPGASELVVELAGAERNPPQWIRIHAGAPGRVTAVTLNGQAVSTFDAKTGVIELPGKGGRGKLVVSY